MSAVVTAVEAVTEIIDVATEEEEADLETTSQYHLLQSPLSY